MDASTLERHITAASVKIHRANLRVTPIIDVCVPGLKNAQVQLELNNALWELRNAYADLQIAQEHLKSAVHMLAEYLQ